jgi:hypothetical protein
LITGRILPLGMAAAELVAMKAVGLRGGSEAF